MESLIQVFRMTELSIDTRINIIKKLGVAINHQLASNCTEALVWELVLSLDPDNSIIDDTKYTRFID